MKVYLLLLAMLSLSFAHCSGEINLSVPAVIGDGGSLVNVTVSLIPGSGDAFVSIQPRTAISTQESIEEAVAYARNLSEKNRECDVVVDFGDNLGTGSIEGPSAGTALAVMTYALLEGKSLRNDTVITGAIDESGDVMPVGGLYEKAKGSADTGARYFITPVENFYEMLLLRDMGVRYNLTVIQARRVDDVVGFMIENKSIEQEGITITKRAVPDIAAYDSSDMAAFSKVAKRMISLEKNMTDALSGGGNETAAAKEFFSSEVLRQGGILERGYFFSAANEAFLNYIDIATIRAVASNDVDLARKKGDAGICLTAIRRPQISEKNFEWVVGSDLRQQWAYDRLDSINAEEDMITDQKYAAYNELMYAQAWCEVAGSLIDAAPPNGMMINESSWKGLAEKKIAQAKTAAPTSEDSLDKLRIAQDSYDKGLYGAAIYDAVYVIENEKNPGSDNISALIRENRTSLWGNVYQSHAAFLYAQNQSVAAYKTVAFAKGLDEATDEMRGKMVVMVPGSNETAKESDDRPLIAAFAISLLIISMILLLRRKNGDDSKRPGQAYRAQQEKGRARVPGKGPWRP